MNSTVDEAEVAKFAQYSQQWWDTEGPLKTLHDINPARLAFIQRYINLCDARVLDVGCGGGILAEAMAKANAQVTGLDVVSDAIAVASAHAATRNLTIDYMCQPIETLADITFDHITCMEMLEHVSNPQTVIKHCERLLKPNGYLFLSTINRTLTAYASAIVAAEYVLKLLPRQTHDFKQFIKPSELAGMARVCGLDVIAISGLSYHPLTRVAGLRDDVSVNYLLVCQKHN